MTYTQRRDAKSSIDRTLSLSVLVRFQNFSRADAIYNVITFGDLSITDFSNHSGMFRAKPDKLQIRGNTLAIDADSIIRDNTFFDQFADATVIENTTNDLASSDSLTQQAIATGEAIMGTAASFALTQGILANNNHSQAESHAIAFEGDWSYLVNANATRHGNAHFATAISDMFLDSHLHGSLFDLTVRSDTDLGGGLLTDNNIQRFSMFLPQVNRICWPSPSTQQESQRLPHQCLNHQPLPCLASDCSGPQSCNGAI